jgi:DNA-binding response OmpR family regulator
MADSSSPVDSAAARLPSNPAGPTGAAGYLYHIDDDALLRRSLGWTLAQAGFAVDSFADAEEALRALAHAQAGGASLPDLLLLDIGLPGMDGLEALRTLQRHVELPVIFVTARRRELEQVLGLELGADDYVTKPFDSDVLVARIRAVLRRRKAPATRPAGQAAPEPRDAGLLVVGDLTIDGAAHRVQLAGRPLELAPREFALLQALARRPDHVLSVEELLAEVWGEGFRGEPQVVYVHMRRLREKMEEDPAAPTRLLTVRGVGYRLAPRDGGESG